MSGIGIITNPHSKLNKRNPGRTAILGYILGTKGQLEVTNSIEDLGRVARDFKSRGIAILAINGGDGTICRTLTAFIKEYGDEPLPKIALLRGGTINVLANNLKIRGTPEQILYRLVEAHSASDHVLEMRRVRTIEVEGSYGCLFGNGAAASFLKEYYKRKSGPIGAFWWVLRVWMDRFFSGKLYYRVLNDQNQTLVADEAAPISHSTCAVFCSTVVNLPLGYPLFRRLRTLEDGFQCVSFTFAAKDAVWQLPVTMLKMTDRANGKMSLTCRKLTIEAEKPFDYTLDGELYVSASNKLTINTGPELEFVTI